MTDDELTVKVASLRKELQGDGRSGEIPRTSTHSDASGNVSGSTRTSRRTSKAVLRSDSEHVRSVGPLDSSNGSRSTVLAGTGQADNRPLESGRNNGTAYTDDQGTAPRRGRLVADDGKEITRDQATKAPTAFSIPKRRGPGRPSKATKADEASWTPIVSSVQATGNIDQIQPSPRIRKTVLKSWFAEKGSTITEQEARELEDSLSTRLIDYGSYLDIYIQYRANRPALVVFGDLSPDEAKVFARLFIKAGKQDARLASGVRTLAKGNDYLSAMIILWPRIRKLIDAFGKEKTA